MPGVAATSGPAEVKLNILLMITMIMITMIMITVIMITVIMITVIMITVIMITIMMATTIPATHQHWYYSLVSPSDYTNQNHYLNPLAASRHLTSDSEITRHRSVYIYIYNYLSMVTYIQGLTCLRSDDPQRRPTIEFIHNGSHYIQLSYIYLQ